MLTGDQLYNNPVVSLKVGTPTELNTFPTTDNVIPRVKELNGVGEHTNGFFGETWSSRISSALFEHEQLLDIASKAEYEVKDYIVDDKDGLSLQLKEVADYMKARTYRNVNREVYVVSQAGYDMHPGDSLGELGTKLNEALKNFVAEVKSQEGLWENTVIVMGSDFGRTSKSSVFASSML